MLASPTQYLFVYGTLKSEHLEHAKFCSHAISVQPAKLAGTLYQLEEGYPILKIAPTQRLANATVNPKDDWTRLSENPIIHQNDNADKTLIEGQLVELPLSKGALSGLDQWECFVPGTTSAYQRYLVSPAESETDQPICWVYATTNPPTSARKLSEHSWQRPKSL